MGPELANAADTPALMGVIRLSEAVSTTCQQPPALRQSQHGNGPLAAGVEWVHLVRENRENRQS